MNPESIPAQPEAAPERRRTAFELLGFTSCSVEELGSEPIGEKPPSVNGREPFWLGNRWYVPNDDWRKMRGMLSGHPDHDTSKVRHEERVWEAEHDERKFGPFSKP